MFVLDIETYPNFFHIGVYDPGTGEYFSFGTGKQDIAKLKSLLENEAVVTYNGDAFDCKMLGFLYSTPETSELELYQLKEMLFDKTPTRMLPTRTQTLLKMADQNVFYRGLGKGLHIDLLKFFAKAPSLKHLGISMFSEKVQDLPYAFDRNLTEEQKVEVVEYCKNDLRTTYDLLKQKRIISDLKVRDNVKKTIEPFNISKRNPFQLTTVKIAEIAMIRELEKRNGKDFFKRFKPSLDFSLNDIVTDGVRDLMLEIAEDHPLNIFVRDLLENKEIRKIETDLLPFLSKSQLKTEGDKFHLYDKEKKQYLKSTRLNLKGKEYTIGLGGLHSVDASCAYKDDYREVKKNSDVTSYYPDLIGKWDMGEIPGFTETMRLWVTDRVKAKRAGDLLTADTKKLKMNSTFGNCLNKHCKFYSPKTFFSITMNGQLFLLYLIAMVQEEIPHSSVINANTDGVCFSISNDKHSIDTYNSIIRTWEYYSKMGMETDTITEWIALGCNEYVAFTDEGKVKSKGKRVGTPRLEGSLNASIIRETMIAYFKGGDRFSLEEYVARNITLNNATFSAKSTKDLHNLNGEKVQKNVRYVVVKDGDVLKNDNVTVNDSVALILDLNTVSTIEAEQRLDLNYYRKETYKLIDEIESGKIVKEKVPSHVRVINAALKADKEGDKIVNCYGGLFKKYLLEFYPSKTETIRYKGLKKTDETFYEENNKGELKINIAENVNWNDALMYSLNLKKHGLVAVTVPESYVFGIMKMRGYLSPKLKYNENHYVIVEKDVTKLSKVVREKYGIVEKWFHIFGVNVINLERKNLNNDTIYNFLKLSDFLREAKDGWSKDFFN